MMHFEKILRPDAKGRICLGSLVKGISSFRTLVDDETHTITLEPYTEIPLAQQWLYKNPEALKSVIKGLEDAKAGRVKSMGSFLKYIKEKD